MLSKILTTILLCTPIWVSSQLTAPSTRAAGACSDCKPDHPSYAILNSTTPDMSNANVAADINTSGGALPWTSVNPVPIPPTGHSEWITLRDIGTFNTNPEAIQLTISELVSGCIYVTQAYTTTVQSPYSPNYMDQFSYTVTGEPTVLVTSITQNSWDVNDIYFEAFGSITNLTFSSLNNSGATIQDDFESLHISIGANSTSLITSPVLNADTLNLCSMSSVNLDTLIDTPPITNANVVWSTDGDKSDGVTGIVTNTNNVTTAGTYFAYYYFPDIDAYTCNPDSIILMAESAIEGTILGNSQACQGDSLFTIQFVGSNGTSPYTFHYNVNGGINQTITSTGDTATMNVATDSSGTFVYTLTSVQSSVSGASCNNQATPLSTDTVIIHSLPNIIAGNDLVVCDGEPITLNATGGQSYDWSNGVINGTSFTPTNGIYSVIGTDGNGCKNIDSILISIEPPLDVSFQADVTSGCTPLEVTFTSSSGQNNTLNDCLWEFGDGSQSTSCLTSNHTFQTPGSFDVSLTVTTPTGCSDTIAYNDYINIEEAPIANFSPSSHTICNQELNVSFTNSSTGASSYIWNFNDGSPESTEISPLHSFPPNSHSNYTVSLIAFSLHNECTDTSSTIIKFLDKLIFYVPNTFTPDGDEFNQTFEPVMTTGVDPYDYSLFIFNRWGDTVFESHNIDFGWDGTYNGNLAQDGIYTWQITFKTTANDERKQVNGHLTLTR